MVDLKCPPQPLLTLPPPPLDRSWHFSGIFASWVLCLPASPQVGKDLQFNTLLFAGALVTWPRLSEGKQLCLLRCHQARPPAPELVSPRVISLQTLNEEVARPPQV